MAKGQAKLFLTILICAVVVALNISVNTRIIQASELATKLFITEVQVSDTEFIELYNPYDQAVSLSGWQVKYRGSGASEATLKTFGATDSIGARGFMLLARGYTIPAGITSTTFTASLANTAGYVVLYDQSGTTSDLVGWGSGALGKQGTAAAVPGVGQSIQRCFISSALALIDPHDNNAEFLMYDQVTPGAGVACIVPEPDPTPIVDVCPNIDGTQSTVPVGYELNQAGSCSIPQVCLLEITEISSQPNYSGQEYVELYNSGQITVSVNLCKIRINSSTDRSLPDVQLGSGNRLVVPFSSGTIRNSAGQVMLVNSNDEILMYSYPETLTSQTSNFESGSQTGVVSDKPTPGAANELVILSEEELAVATGETTLAPCPAGKYRNPDTNRCKNLEAATAVVAACAADQERNPETNRCRKIDTATLAACKEDQERSPETNRCRKIGSDSSLAPCQVGQERNPDTNRCRKVAATTNAALTAVSSPAAINPMRFGFKIVALILAAVVGYGVYEYRGDLHGVIQKIRANSHRGRPPD